MTTENTMDDRTLLALAAKAAGLHPEKNLLGDNGFADNCGSGWFQWNPLSDDGDALRLAVKLGIDIRLFHMFFARCPPEEMRVDCLVDRLGRGFVELVGDDPYAATRRCIVRAAAEIGARSNVELTGLRRPYGEGPIERRVRPPATEQGNEK